MHANEIGWKFIIVGDSYGIWSTVCLFASAVYFALYLTGRSNMMLI